MHFLWALDKTALINNGQVGCNDSEMSSQMFVMFQNFVGQCPVVHQKQLLCMLGYNVGARMEVKQERSISELF